MSNLSESWCQTPDKEFSDHYAQTKAFKGRRAWKGKKTERKQGGENGKSHCRHGSAVTMGISGEKDSVVKSKP